MISTTVRSRGGARGIALIFVILVAEARLARADDQPPGPPPGALAPGSPALASGPPGSAPGSDPVAYPPPPAPGYGPVGYAAPMYASPINGPERITDYDEGQPIPPGYSPVSRRRKGLIIAGACVFGGVYGYTALGASYAQEIILITGSNADVTSLWIPVAGPFLELGETDNAVARFGLIVDGAAQAAGAIMLLYGLTSPKTILLRNDQLSRLPVIRPMVTRNATGLAVMGRF